MLAFGKGDGEIMSEITTNVELIIACLRAGDVAAIPTETVYGLAGSALDQKAINKIYSLKNRPLTHPLIMHIAKNWELTQWVSMIPDYVYILIEHFWPGPLTIVGNCTQAINPLITGGQTTVALRSPAHPLAVEILTKLGSPLVAPSANKFGKISPTTAAHVQQSFAQEPLLILDGGRCKVGIESTIILATANDHYQILRHGTISATAINAVLANHGGSDLKYVENTVIYQQEIANKINIPGSMAVHYQPQKPLYYFTNGKSLAQFCQQAACSIYALTFSNNLITYAQFNYCFPSSSTKTAFEFYYRLRSADASDATLIAAELPSKTAEWAGIYEKLIKAGLPGASFIDENKI